MADVMKVQESCAHVFVLPIEAAIGSFRLRLCNVRLAMCVYLEHVPICGHLSSTDMIASRSSLTFV